MNNDTRVAVSAHILALLALVKGKPLTSELLARSVTTNAVVIRRLVSQMKKAGLVSVHRGPGGAVLRRAPEEITLLDIYSAVIPRPHACPFYLHQTPNSQCFVGRHIHDALEMPLAKVTQAMKDSMATTTVADIAAFIKTRLEKDAALGKKQVEPAEGERR